MADPVLHARTGSGAEWDDPSEDMLFELLQDIDRGDEEYLTLARLESSEPNRVRINRASGGSWFGFDDVSGVKLPQADWDDVRAAHAWLTEWAFGVPVAREAKLLPAFGVGLIVYAQKAMRFVADDMGAIETQGPIELPEDQARLIIVFEIPASKVQGVRVRSVDRKDHVIGVDVGVPADLAASDTAAYLRGTLSEALRLAEAHLGKRKLQLRLDAARAAIDIAIDALATPALDAVERFRVIDGEHGTEWPVRTYVELDGRGRDLRRVDEYADHRFDYAIRAVATGATRRNEVRLRDRPDAERGVPMQEAAFEAIWQRAINQPTPRGELRVLDRRGPEIA